MPPHSMLAVLAVLALTAAGAAEEFHPERTRLVQDIWLPSGHRNVVFRGNEPVVTVNGTQTFALQALLASFNASSSKPLPQSFSLIDVSFLNPAERSDENVEKAFYAKEPSAGEYINWVLIGSVFGPGKDAILLKERAETFATWSLDRLPERIEKFRTMVTTDRNSSQVFYFHCEAGTDRTGEFAGAYYLRYLNMTFQQALSIDNHIQNRDMETTSRNSMQWYCYYLHYTTKGFEHLDCRLP